MNNVKQTTTPEEQSLRPSEVGITKVKAASLRVQVYTQLKEKLTRGVWKIGERLPSESELCAQFGVSRVTVRAAIQQLEILGLVETKHGGGTFVRDFSSIEKLDTFHPLMQVEKNRDLITVLEYRKIIEKGAMGLAHEKASAEDLNFLEETYTAMVNAEKDTAAYTRADLAFHYRLAEITRNPIIIKVYDILNDMLSTAMADIVHLLGRDLGLTYHRKLIDSLKKGDKNKSEALMEEHIEMTIQAIKKRRGEE
ncbi:MAG: FadR family transcriptional regulator [Treponema sp.]|jgi:GntR family transcriptional repressor for pyruvate dehydrogenase complex|nr:FadR family transcriptional regulator [Treponema sp.]